MNRRWFVMTLLVVCAPIVAAGGWFTVRSFLRERQPNFSPRTPSETKAAGRLVVLVVFDQMRGDYLQRWASLFSQEGFERIKREGVWFSNAHIPYACTSTAPGHASIATGAPPAIHGIVENAWLERSEGVGPARLTYCVQPRREYALLPTIPAGAGRPERGSELGFSPEQLRSPTVSDLLRSTDPASKVVSLSIKDRAAVLMGGKAHQGNALGVYCFDVRDGSFHTNAYYADGVAKWVRAFNADRARFDAWVGRDWNVFRSDVDYAAFAGPDAAPGEDYGINQGQIFPHPMNKNAPQGGPDYYRALEVSPFANELLLALAKNAIVSEDLGRRGSADLLCLSFSSNDLIGHRWGPDSWEVLDVTLRSDALIKNLIDFLDSHLGRDHYTLVMTSDHGVCPLPEARKYPLAERVKSRDVLMGLAAALGEAFGPADLPEKWFEKFEAADDVWPWVYLNRAELRQRNIPYEAVCDYAAQWLGNQRYTLTAFTRRQIEQSQAPPLPPQQEQTARQILERVKLAYDPQRCGDVIVIPERGCLITKYPVGTGHGSPYDYDTHVPILALGAGIPSVGERSEPVSSLIVAPLLATSLGLPPPEHAREPLPQGLMSQK